MTQKINIPKERLIELYRNRKLSTYKIAKIFKCDPTLIQKRLKEHKISLRQPKKKIEIPKAKLRDLYINKRLSTQKISRLLNISPCAAYYKLKEHNIEIRKKKIIEIYKKNLEDLYINKKMSCSQIAKLYKCDAVTIFNKLKKYKIQRRSYYEANIKYPKKEFDGGDILKAYMIGFRLGDLNVKALNKKSTIVIKSCTTKEDQLNLIRKVYGSYGHLWKKNYQNVYNIMVFLDNSFNFLINKEDKIENWILQNDDSFLAFLGGYIDAEGNFGVYDKRARFRLGTYEKNILLEIQLKLISLGVKTKFRLEGEAGSRNQNKDFYRISINEKLSLLKFIRLIKTYIKHEKRYNDMLKCEANILERNKNKELGIR